jgi:hydroxymethylglutaryl-CoA synthase
MGWGVAEMERSIMNVGIDHIATYVPGHYLSLRDLASARNIDENKFLVGIGIEEMAVPSPSEDVVVLAANAGYRVLKEAGVSPREIGLLIVGTESAEDKAKPTATHVHSLLAISESCRVYDILHACAGATYGLLSAVDWARDPRHKYALVIATDIARYGVGTPGEPTQGAGAVAMLISKAPRLMKIEELSTYSTSVYDFWKPLDERYPIVKGVYSVQCYLNAAKACFSTVAINTNAAFLYHTPYPKLVEKAHAEVAALIGEAANWRKHYSDKVSTSITYPSRVGNTYTASLWLALVSFLESCYEGAIQQGVNPLEAMKEHEGVYLFSYGSGCGAILMQGEMMDSWPAMVGAFKVRNALNSRRRLTVSEYERLLESSAAPSPADQLGGSHFQFDGIRNSQRHYSMSPSGEHEP